MKSIDFKSLLIGILGTALVMVLMGLSSSDKNQVIQIIENCEVSSKHLPHHKKLSVARVKG
jgi:hypothetical protein